MDGADGFLYSQLLNSISRKRKLQREEEEKEPEGDDLEETVVASIQGIVQIAANQGLKTKYRKPRKNRQQQQMFWTNGYENWNIDEFKGRLRVNRDTFVMILERISPFISKSPTNFAPNPVGDRSTTCHDLIWSGSWVFISSIG